MRVLYMKEQSNILIEKIILRQIKLLKLIQNQNQMMQMDGIYMLLQTGK